MALTIRPHPGREVIVRCLSPLKRVRHVARVTAIQTNQNLGAGLIDGIDVDANYRLPLPALGTLLFTLNGSYLLKDTITAYRGAHTYVWKGVQIRGGINNLLDKDPPVVTSEIVSGGAANTYATYDLMGRQMYLAKNESVASENS